MPKITLSKHALDRARSRKMELYAIEQLILFPDQKTELEDGKCKFQKNISGRHYQAVGTWLAKENKWLIISVWVRGEEDELPLAWRIIILPVQLLWWLLRSIGSGIWQIAAKTARKK
jgi:hypothetical protein